MEIEKVGAAIAYLRKRAGYTQKDLADRLGISDKAVSKWERGLGLPDVTSLGKLSILLDTDTDSLLQGDIIHHDQGWKGLLILDDNPCGIGAGTMVYDKPLVYFLLSYFLLVGIKDIRCIVSERDRAFMEREFDGGRELGIHLSFGAGDDESSDVECGVMTVFGRSIIYGVDQTRFFRKAMQSKSRLTILSLPRRGNTARRVFFNMDRKIVEEGIEEQLRTQYDYSDLPVMFSPASVVQSCKTSDDVRAAIASYAEVNDIFTQVLDRGYVEFLLNDWNSVHNAAQFVRLVQEACGMNIYCIEEVAWRRGMIGTEQLMKLGKKKKDTKYGEYILDFGADIEFSGEKR